MAPAECGLYISIPYQKLSNPLPVSHSPPLPLLTGVGFLQLGGVTSIEGIYRSVREGAPTLKMNGSIVE